MQLVLCYHLSLASYVTNLLLESPSFSLSLYVVKTGLELAIAQAGLQGLRLPVCALTHSMILELKEASIIY